MSASTLVSGRRICSKHFPQLPTKTTSNANHTRSQTRKHGYWRRGVGTFADLHIDRICMMRPLQLKLSASVCKQGANGSSVESIMQRSKVLCLVKEWAAEPKTVYKLEARASWLKLMGGGVMTQCSLVSSHERDPQPSVLRHPPLTYGADP